MRLAGVEAKAKMKHQKSKKTENQNEIKTKIGDKEIK